jgi:phage tail protein X
MGTYSRYDRFIKDGAMKMVPFIKIPKKNTDKYTYYISNISRLDMISYQYYGDSNYGWLILQANPELGPYEFAIPNNTRIRIPYPLSTTLTQYANDVETYEKFYGIE